MISDITLYHFEADNQNWSKSHYRASLYHTASVSAESSGLVWSKMAIIRIFTKSEIPLAIGDKVVCEQSFAPLPDRDKSLTVMGWTDNRQGGAYHWKVMCK